MRYGLWPLLENHTIIQIRDLLSHGPIQTFVPPDGIEKCATCLKNPLPVQCRNVADLLHFESVGLELNEWRKMPSNDSRGRNRKRKFSSDFSEPESIKRRNNER